MSLDEIRSWLDVLRTDQAALILAVWLILETRRFFARLRRHLTSVEDKLDSVIWALQWRDVARPHRAERSDQIP
mgnify:CR=1 FL=1